MVITTGIFLWGLFGNVRSEVISAADQDKWRLPILFPRVPWYWLVIGFLVITLLAVLEGAYRSHARRMEEANREQDQELRKFSEEITNDYQNEIKSLKASHAGEMSMLKAESSTLKKERNSFGSERNSYKSELEEIKRYKLILEVDTNEQSQVMLAYFNRQRGFKYSELWRIRPDLKIRFINNDVHRVTVLGLSISLIRIDDGRETEIPLDAHKLKVYRHPDMSEIDFNTLPVDGGDTTQYYWFMFHLEVLTEYAERIDSNYFCESQWGLPDKPHTPKTYSPIGK